MESVPWGLWICGTDIPLNKRYAELTPEQRAMVKAQYEDMPEADEPPYPIDGLGAVYKAAIASSARIANDIGAVLFLQKYKPAVCNGAPCRMEFPFRFMLGAQ